MSTGIDARAYPGMPAGAIFTRAADFGPAWVESAEIGQTLVSAGIGKSPIYRHSGWVDVRDYASFEAAVAIAPAGSNVYLPPGSYPVTTGAVFERNIAVRGAGMRASILVVSPGVDALTIRCPAGGIDGCRFGDFGITGGSRGIVITDAPGASYGLVRSTLERIAIQGTTGEALYSDCSEILETDFRHIWTTGGTYGGRFLTTYLNVCSFDDCQWRESALAGLYLQAPESVVLKNNLWESNARTGLVLDQMETGGVVLLGGWFENNGTDGGGTYPQVIIEATSGISYGVQLINVRLPHGAGNHLNGIQVLGDVRGPLTFDNCWFGGGEGVSVVDVSGATNTGILGRGRKPTIAGSPLSVQWQQTDGAFVAPTVTADTIAATTLTGTTLRVTASGSFTMDAAASKTISDPHVTATSIVIVMPVNGPAGTIIGSAKSLLVSARSAGVSFTVVTANGASAAGTEIFQYLVVN